ncbi:MAG: NUDIX domain-containing protein, partial [Rickettsiales bacterium]|nr:NUDIX domain-containing protein [Rickettsiales bacterium]
HAKERMTDAELWDAAMACLNPQDPFTHNQAMMDIGSLLCTPTSPRCRECPLAKECRGKHAWERFPARKEKSSTPTRFKKMLVACTTDQRYHLTPRDARLLGGLYGFPEFELLSPLEFQGITLAPELLQPLGQVRWAYSHFKLQADVLLYRAASQGENHWYNLDEISSLPLAGVDLKIMELIKQNLPKP